MNGADLLAYAVDLCGAAETQDPDAGTMTFHAADSCGTVHLRGHGSAVVITDLRGPHPGPLVCRSQAAVREAVATFAFSAGPPTPELTLITPLGRLSGTVYAPEARPGHRPQAPELQLWLRGPGLGGRALAGALELLVYERPRANRWCWRGEWTDLAPHGQSPLAQQAWRLGEHLRGMVFLPPLRVIAGRRRAEATLWAARHAHVHARTHRRDLEAQIAALTQEVPCSTSPPPAATSTGSAPTTRSAS